jgi:hypothetical protein
MTTIRITEFKGYTEEDFLSFLRIHSRSFYEIIIPKELGLEQDGEMFVQDYYNAIYVGQLLSRIAHDIFWTHPNPLVKGEFSFIIITGRLKKLAALLHYFGKAFDWEDNEEACMQFQIKAADIVGLLQKGEEYACHSYIHFLNQYFEENED